MKRRQEMIVTIIVLGLASAMQASKARELPDQIRQFADEQYQEIRMQGMEARQAIRQKLKDDYELQRTAFVESQGRSIRHQGDMALAAIQDRFRGNPIASLDAVGVGSCVAVKRRDGAIGRGPVVAQGPLGTEVHLVQLDGLQAWTQPRRSGIGS